MNRGILITRAVAGLLFLVQLVLGVIFWTGRAVGLTGLHMLLGVLFVVALWTLALLCARAGAPRGLVASTVVWGAIVLLLGMTQAQILPGGLHWTVRVVHLLVGMAAMGFAGRLAMSIGGVRRASGGDFRQQTMHTAPR
jgi:hypothetical protein